ncbi:MAG: chemotaxis protein, partial [Methylobacter sp.]
EIVSQIAGASAEQTAGIDQVNQAVAQMDDITQQNAALAGQAAAGSIAMREQSTNMTRLLSFFKVGSKGASHSVKTIERSKPPAAPVAAPKRVVPASTSKSRHDDSEWEEF